MGDEAAENEGRSGLEARLDALEILAAHQDETIADLNRMITAQWSEIDGLKRRIEALSDQVEDVVAGAGEGDPQKPPPHY